MTVAEVAWHANPEKVSGRPAENKMVHIANDSPLTLKPKGGLWTSPDQSEYGWREWCGSEMGHWLGARYVLTVRPSPRLLVVDSMEDLNALYEKFPLVPDKDIWGPRFSAYRALDFEAMTADHDGLWLTAGGHFDTRMPDHRSGWMLGTNGWDCETVLWFRWHFDAIRKE